MSYLIIALKIILIEYCILFFHEFLHYIASLILGFKATSFYLIPFNIYKDNSKYKFKIDFPSDSFYSSRLHFNSINLYSKLEYNILLTKLRLYFWIGPIFDFVIFVIFIVFIVFILFILFIAFIVFIVFFLFNVFVRWN